MTETSGVNVEVDVLDSALMDVTRKEDDSFAVNEWVLLWSTQTRL